MARCYFADEPPEIERRGDMAFIMPIGARCEIALSARTLGLFVARANRVLDEMHDQSNVIPFAPG